MKNINYKYLKDMAKESKTSVKNLIALAPNNDPFYFGAPAQVTQAQWFADVWERSGFTQGAHLRRLHYWCVSQGDFLHYNGKAYENTNSHWKDLCQASKAARYLNYVRIEDIKDHKNPDPHIYAKYYYNEPGFYVEAPELDDPWVDITGFNDSDVQPYHLEVWCEKSTMNDVLIPACQRFSANLVTGEGEMSITAVNDLMRRLGDSDKPARIFYISDFDPAGLSMPRAVARKIEYLLNKHQHQHEVKLYPLVLNRDQVDKYKLPRVPIKESEARAASFEKIHGQGAVELDALEALYPGQLGKIVSEAMALYYDHGAVERMNEKKNQLRQAIQDQVDDVLNKYENEIRALDQMTEELRNISIEGIEFYQPEKSDPDVQDGELFWLYDSKRNYLDQIEAYKGYGNGDNYAGNTMEAHR